MADWSMASTHGGFYLHGVASEAPFSPPGTASFYPRNFQAKAHVLGISLDLAIPLFSPQCE